MNGSYIDSPLRRSEIGGIRTVLSSKSAINDDDEERRASRAHHVSLLQISSTNSAIAESDELKNCLKKFVDNKINKDNAWSMSLIDNFSVLIEKHHKSLNSFQVCGTSLEASSKIYGYRVDSIYDEVLRISSGLTRHKHTNRGNDNAEDRDNNDDDIQQNTNEDGNTSNQNNVQSKTKKKRTRKPISTVTKNKDSINAKLDTHPFIDPMFAKINSVIGDISSSNKLLINTLPSVNSELILRTDHKYWDDKKCEEIVMIDDIEKYEFKTDQFATMPFKLKFTNDDLLRPECSGYIITDTPAEDDDKEDKTPDNSFTDDIDIDVAFDINAEIEPIENAHTYVDVDLDQDYHNLTETDQAALNACRGLRRAPIMIEDMRPIDSRSTTLEYSYRPLDNISQFWAGPSHWKFKKQRLTNAQTGCNTIAESHLSQQQQQQQQQNNQKGKTTKRRTLRNRLEPIIFDDKINEEIQSLFISVNSKLADKLKKTNIYKKWDGKKLKLPTDYKLDDHRFESYYFAPGLKYNINSEPSSTPDIEATGYNYDNPADVDYCSNIVPDDDTDTERSVGGGDVNLNHDIDDIAINNTTVAEIATVFEGAPAKITKIDVPYAKRAKVIDMKQLKKCSLSLLEKQFKETEILDLLKTDKYGKSFRNGEATFAKTYKMLPTVLTKNMKEALTPSVAYYSLLHLANEHKLRFFAVKGNNQDFVIRQINNT